MRKMLSFWKVVVLDLLGITCMVLAILTGWLPGPGGIPLFIVGLSLLAINHEWAQKYIDNLQDYVSKLGEIIFDEDPLVQLMYDIICPILVLAGAYLLWHHSATWTISLGIFLVFTGITILLGNRNRWTNFKRIFKRKH